jgi:hypothetical protein
MKKYLFNQPAGLGDILLLMAIAQKWKNEGHAIIWPIDPVYGDIGYSFPEIKFLPQHLFFLYNYYDAKHFIFEDDEYKSFPFRWADFILNGKSNEATCMKDKYTIVDLPFEMWRTYKISRNFEKETELYKLLKIEENEEFNFINENQTRLYQKTKIEVNNGLRNVYMNAIPGYNMFDWMKIIYKAKTIHTVSTALVLLIERLEDIPAIEQHIYPRIWDAHRKDPYEFTRYFLQKNYIFHYAK